MGGTEKVVEEPGAEGGKTLTVLLGGRTAATDVGVVVGIPCGG